MIIFLTIVIAIFIILNVLAFIFVTIDEWYDYDTYDSIHLKISYILLISEGIGISLLVVVAISYAISHSIVCGVTNNDYKGCKIQEEVQEQVMINE